jgi:hypothetical protein
MSRPTPKRILLKLSGEVLMGEGAFGIDPATVDRIAGEVAAAKEAGFEICMVVGGGNIFRGMAGAAKGMDRAQADYMGMLATVMNALAMQNALGAAFGVPDPRAIRHRDGQGVRALYPPPCRTPSGKGADRDLRRRRTGARISPPTPAPHCAPPK